MPSQSTRRRRRRRRLLTFHLNYFFSRTTWPISTNLDRKYAWEIGIKLCLHKGAAQFWGPIRVKIRKTGRNASIFGIEYS